MFPNLQAPDRCMLPLRRMLYRAITIALITIMFAMALGLTRPAHAAGQKCGRSHISWTKTCHR